ncbi:membrane bound O-acyl transferase family-domain-containing protein [Paraphoma chrysanthemicola]|nr:membrane bound O-acyl transferase family-domain-containing protein [Paraphoma chrysanthemicola]
MSVKLPDPLIHLQLPLIYANNIIALAIGPKHQVLRLGITLPILSLLASQSLYREWTGEWGMHYALECLMLACIWTYVDWNILNSPDKEQWRRVRSQDGISKHDTVPQGFWTRMWWGVRLATGNRYLGWTCQVKNVPVEVDEEYPRLLFIVRKSIRFVTFFILTDVLYAYTAAIPHGSWTDIAHIKPARSFSSEPFLTRVWFAWVHVVLTYVSMEHANAAYGVVSVATGLARPKDCPSLFGDLKGLWSVRKAWSSVWHQQMRRICSAPGIFLARDVLGLRKGSFGSKYLQLFTGFAISGIIHAGASMVVHRSLDEDAAFATFIGQAVIIMAEDHVIALGKRLGLRDSAFWRLVGFAWTVLAIGASTERWTGKVVGHGMWVHDRKPDYFRIGPK